MKTGASPIREAPVFIYQVCKMNQPSFPHFSVPPRRKVAAALSAAVTTTNPQETAPNLQGHLV